MAERSTARRSLVRVGVLVFVLAVALARPVPIPAASCQFILGFAVMPRLVPRVGACLDNQSFSGNGDAVQHTTGGLLVWRKADNWTAFTDGYRTWVNGPYGLQQRLNTERFGWEQRPTPTAAQLQTWIESWNDLSNWDSIGSTDWAPQHGSLRTIQQSAGLLSKRRWDATHDLAVTCTVQARPAAGSTSTSFWAGLTLSTPDTTQNLYAEIEEIGTYPPGADASSGIQSCHTFIGGSQDKVLMPYRPWDVHTLQLAWHPSTGMFEYWVDGVLRQSINNNSIDGALAVELVVTSVLP